MFQQMVRAVGYLLACGQELVGNGCQARKIFASSAAKNQVERQFNNCGLYGKGLLFLPCFDILSFPPPNFPGS
jgi:hypothetical protein